MKINITALFCLFLNFFSFLNGMNAYLAHNDALQLGSKRTKEHSLRILLRAGIYLYKEQIYYAQLEEKIKHIHELTALGFSIDLTHARNDEDLYLLKGSLEHALKCLDELTHSSQKRRISTHYTETMIAQEQITERPDNTTVLATPKPDTPTVFKKTVLYTGLAALFISCAAYGYFNLPKTSWHQTDSTRTLRHITTIWSALKNSINVVFLDTDC